MNNKEVHKNIVSVLFSISLRNRISTKLFDNKSLSLPLKHKPLRVFWKQREKIEKKKAFCKIFEKDAWTQKLDYFSGKPL